MGLDQDLETAIEGYATYFKDTILNNYEIPLKLDNIDVELSYSESGTKIRPDDRKIKFGRDALSKGSGEEFKHHVQRKLYTFYSAVIEEEVKEHIEQYGEGLDIDSDLKVRLSSRNEEPVYKPGKDELTVNPEDYDEIGPEEIARTALHGKLRGKIGADKSSVYHEEVSCTGQEDDFFSGCVESIGDIFTAYHLGMENVQKNSDLDFEAPELIVDELDDGSGYRIDAENNYIEIDADLIGNLDRKLLVKDAALMADWFYDESVKHSLEELTEYIDDTYSKWDTETSIDTAYFDSLGEGRAAEQGLKRKNGKKIGEFIRIDSSKKPDFDPVNGIFGSEMDYTMVHEVAHALESQNSPVIDGIRQRVSQRSENGNKYRDNIHNSLREVISTFEQAMAGSEKYSEAHKAANDPTRLPIFFEGYFDLEEEPTKNWTIRDPYNLPLFTALSLNKALVQEYGLEEGMQRTRDWILNEDKDLDSMKSDIERSLEMRGLSNFPKIYEETYHQLEASDNPVRTAEEEAEKILEKDFEDPMNEYLEGRAVIKATEDQHLMPETDLKELDKQVCDLMDEL